MAKAKAETSLMGELFQGRLFKSSQGRVVRQVTALAVAAVFVAMAWRLHGTILSDVGGTVFLGIPGTAAGVSLPGNLVRLGLPALLAVVGCWIAFRLVNWPTFANFLISVEAEMDKVSWASWDYLKRATAVVLVLMVFLGAFLFFCDIFWQQVFVMVGFLDFNALGSWSDIGQRQWLSQPARTDFISNVCVTVRLKNLEWLTKMRGSPMDEERSSTESKPTASAQAVVGPKIECVTLAGEENPNMQWFVLKVQSNRERSIRDSILRRIRMEGMEEQFGQVFIPTEKIVETKGGGRRVREQKLLPGYMMIQMELGDESWHLVRSTSGVGDFTGAAGKPIPMEDKEVRRWLGLESEVEVKGAAGGVEKPAKAVVKFEIDVGDQVKVKEGAFESFEGTIDSVDGTTGKVKIIIEIFGRPTEVELEHWQVEKV